MNNEIIKFIWWLFIKMLLGCLIISITVSLLCVLTLPKDSIQRSCTLIGGPIIFFVWHFIKLRHCYVNMKGERYYYLVNLGTWFCFLLVNIISYMFLSRVLYSCLFSITGFIKFSNIGIETPTSIIVFHFVTFLSIFLAPIGLSWIKLKEKEEEELREMAPGILEVNPLEQKRDSTEVQTNEIQKTKEKDSLS